MRVESLGNAEGTDELSPWESRITRHGFPVLRNTKDSPLESDERGQSTDDSSGLWRFAPDMQGY
jgi:hypothetical protein